MASVTLLKMPAASFASTFEAILILEFHDATSWQMPSLQAWSSSNSSWEALSKGGRVLHAELILLPWAHKDSAQVNAARLQVPALVCSSVSSKVLPFLSLGPQVGDGIREFQALKLLCLLLVLIFHSFVVHSTLF
jgi:hypothetical protein